MFYPLCTNFLSPRLEKTLAFSLRQNDQVFDAFLKSISVVNAGKVAQKKCRILTLEDNTILPVCEVSNKIPFVKMSDNKGKVKDISLNKIIKMNSVKDGDVFILAPNKGNEEELNEVNKDINLILSSDDKFSVEADDQGALVIFYNKKEIPKPTDDKMMFGSYAIWDGEVAHKNLFVEKNKKQIDKEKLIEDLKKTGSVVAEMYSDGNNFKNKFTFDYMVAAFHSIYLNIDALIQNKDKIVKQFPLKKVINISESEPMECVDISFNFESTTLLATSDYNVI